MLGNKLVKLRKENKLSQDSLADKLGITRQTISNWELNITKPDIVQIKNISEIFIFPTPNVLYSCWMRPKPEKPSLCV